MKRFATAAVAATTALSLAVVPAGAVNAGDQFPNGLGYDSSSKVSEDEAVGYAALLAIAERLEAGTGLSAPFKGSSKAGVFQTKAVENGKKSDAIFLSSYKNDANNGYKLGTTYDILVGTGIAATVLALLGGVAVQQGLVKLPF